MIWFHSEVASTRYLEMEINEVVLPLGVIFLNVFATWLLGFWTCYSLVEYGIKWFTKSICMLVEISSTHFSVSGISWCHFLRTISSKIKVVSLLIMNFSRPCDPVASRTILFILSSTIMNSFKESPKFGNGFLERI